MYKSLGPRSFLTPIFELIYNTIHFQDIIKEEIEFYKSCKNFREYQKKKHWLSGDVKKLYNRKDVRDIEKECLNILIPKFEEEARKPYDNFSKFRNSIDYWLAAGGEYHDIFSGCMDMFKHYKVDLKYECFENESLSNEEKVERYKKKLLHYANNIVPFWPGWLIPPFKEENEDDRKQEINGENG